MSDFYFGGREPTTLMQLLMRREQRAAEQKKLLARSPCVISFALNIPGAQKSFPLTDLCFGEGMREILSAIAPHTPEEQWEYAGATGRECLLTLRADAKAIKRSMMELEQTHPLGRLWDIDVLDESGRSLSRTQLGGEERRCIVCGGNAKACARSVAHPAELVFEKAYRQMDDYFCARTEKTLADCAEKAMRQEVSTTPKPGLVDRRNSGAHTDMDYALFLKSIDAIAPWLRVFARIGWQGAAQSDKAVFERLRAAGQQAETAMFAATGGVNTHKGFIFSIAILCAAAARVRSRTGERLRSDTLSAACASLARYALGDLESTSGDSAGLRIYRAHRLAGVRGEAADGFPSVFTVGFPALRCWLLRGASLNDASAAALLELIAKVEDTNLIHRGGLPAAEKCRGEAAALLEQLAPETIAERLAALDRQYVQRNLSPGGSADLLALSLFLHALVCEGLLEPVEAAQE